MSKKKYNSFGAAISLAALLAGLAATPVGAESVWDTPPPEAAEQSQTSAGIVVYRSPNCQCCGKWMEHLSRSGFTVTDKPVIDMNRIKQQLGITRPLASCHTAIVGNYVIEGHVPAADIRRLLREQPEIAGLAVPGMPHGTPGMETGKRRDDFRVIAFDRDGKQHTYSEYSDY